MAARRYVKSWLRRLFRRSVDTLVRSAALRRRTRLRCEALEARATPSISGLVYQDFNSNGILDETRTIPNVGFGTVAVAQDRGLGGVRVTAFDASGNQVGTTTTAADGTYTVTGPVPGQQYRLQFTNLLPGFFPGPHGPDNGTTVQFVDGGATNVRLGLVRPTDYSVDDPTVVAVCYVYGDQINGSNRDSGVIVSFPFSAGATDPSPGPFDQPTTHALAVSARQVGTTYGITYDRPNATLYAASYTKLHTGYGPGGNGAVYAINPTTGAVSTFADLNALFGPNTAGVNFRAGYGPGDTPYFYDSLDTANSWDAVGKTSLGGLDVSDDGNTLYVMNLADRKLYAMPTNLGRPLMPSDVRSVLIPLNAPGATGTNGADLRPFAVKYYQGQVYVGIVNSAESTIGLPGFPDGDPSKLLAYVYTVDPATLTFSSNPVFQMGPLNYPRDQAARFENLGPGDWHPWTPVFRDAITDPTIGGLVYAQPMFTGIAFDVNGNMVLGLRDRVGDQGGDFAPADRNNLSQLYETYPAGETLRAFHTGNGWTLENNARGPNGEGIGPQNTGLGPGGGQFYFQQDYNPPGGHGYVTGGAVAQLPGFPDIVVNAYDPAYNGDFQTGGLRWFNNATGALDKSYQLYARDDGHQTNFGKASGIGGVTFISPPAPIEIGNRVWRDGNGNGLQDAGEPGIGGVTVHLYNQVGTLLATTTTDVAGNYYFSNLTPNTTYTVRLDNPADYATGGALAGLMATHAFVGTDTSIDSNGQVVAPNDIRASVATGGPGANDHTFDLGFTAPLALGDFVWIDADNDGVFDNNETPLASVPVRLYDANNNLLAMTTTDAAGHYLFTGLFPGTYRVEITPPAGYVSSTGTVGSATGPYEPGVNNNQNNVDHGTQNGAVVTTALVTLLSAGGNPDTVFMTGDANLRQDFGFFQPLALGDFVWNDANNNGVLDGGESPIPGVVLRLRDGNGNLLLNAGGNPITATTDASGHYLFVNLIPGAYTVEVAAGNFAAGGPLAGFVSSTGVVGGLTGPFEPAQGNSLTNNQDHGTTQPDGSVRTNPVTLLTPGNAGNPDPGPGGAGSANLRQDFGFFQPLALGDLVWNDANNDGVVDNGEQGIPDITVRLLDQNGNIIATATTDATGHYLFSYLIPGTYRVQILPPPGCVSSTGVNSSKTGPYEPGLLGTDFTNNADHGTTQPDGSITTGLVTLGLPGSAQNPDNNGLANLRQDFGVFKTLSVGNFVWEDTNNNGVVDPGEPGLANVVVNLRDQNGNLLATTTTNAQGGYLFTYLIPALYRVEIAASNFAPGGPLAGYHSSTGIPGSDTGPFEPAPDNNIDNQDKGTTVGNVVQGGLINLQTGTQPTGETPTPGGLLDPALDANSNLTQDFGFFRTTADVALTKTVDAANVTHFALVTFTFVVRNLGPGQATDVTVSDPFPAGLTFVSAAQPTQGRYDGATGLWFVGTLANGATASLRVTAQVTGTGAIVNRAAVAEDQTDPTLSNNVATVTIQSAALPSDVTKQDILASTPPPPGPIEVTTLPAPRPGSPAWIVTGADAGNLPLVQVFDRATGQLHLSFLAYDPAFRGGVRVALGDVNGDGVPDIITGAGPGGGPHVKVFDGVTGRLLQSFFAYDASFLGGVTVAAGDITGAGHAAIITGAGPGGGPHVKAFDGVTGQLLRSFFAYSAAFFGGITVAAGDTTGAGHANIITGAGPGGGPHVKVFDGITGQVLQSFFAYTPAFLGGITVAAGNVDGSGRAAIITGAGPGGGPHVRVFRGTDLAELASFFASDFTYTGGLRVGAADVLGAGRDDVLYTLGSGRAPTVTAYDVLTRQQVDAFFAYDPTFLGGVFIGGARRA